MLNTYPHINLLLLHTIFLVLDLFFLLEFFTLGIIVKISQYRHFSIKKGKENLNPNSYIFITMSNSNYTFSLTLQTLLLS